MKRSVWFLIVVALMGTVAVWLVDRPGSVSLQWLGYQVDTSMALLLVAFVVVVVAVIALYRLWLLILTGPDRFRQARREGRQRKGFEALTRGMAALAAGDADGAQREVRRAGGLLGDPPLTMVLSAQSAQLAGDDKTAARFFTAMLDRPDTEFLGVRGLLTQALKDNDRAEALELARRAYRLRPDSQWAVTTLLDLLIRSRLWVDAGPILADATKQGYVSAEEGRRRRAVIAYEMALDAERSGNRLGALKKLREAHEGDPSFIPAGARLADALIKDGKLRKAAGVIETAWKLAPHPDLVPVYMSAKKAEQPPLRLRAVQHLSRVNPFDAETQISLAAAALEARQWELARRHLDKAVELGVTGRVCRLMAQLEESEGGDAARAQDWLVRAAHADPDPAWVCGQCGHVVESWTGLCSTCDSFNSFTWRRPPTLAAPAPRATGEPVDALEPAE